MSWRTTLFGPSRADAAEAANMALLETLREDRAAFGAVLTQFMANAEAQTALASAQFALLTAPQPTPQVRLMTPAIEAQFERDRMVEHGVPVHTVPADPSRLLSDLQRDFSTLSLS